MYKYELAIDDLVVNIYFDDYKNKDFIDLKEARHKAISLKGPYLVYLDSPHIPQGQKHIHVYRKNNQIFAFNMDGSAHDKSHGVKIPKKVAKALSDIFPNFELPNGNIIESLILNQDSELDKKTEKLLLDLLQYLNPGTKK
jgi:hypothetical protein